MTLIAYSRLGARVFKLTSHYGQPAAQEISTYEVNNLDREIVQWYEKAPEEVKIKDWSQEKRMVTTPSYNLRRLRIWTYLRFNQVRKRRELRSHVKDISNLDSFRLTGL